MRFLLSLFVFFSVSAMADVPQYFLGAGVASYHYADKRHLDDSTMANGILGYTFSDKLGVECLYGHAASFSTYTGDVLYYMGDAHASFRPYTLSGVGVTNQQEAGAGNTTLLAVNAGLGLEYLFSSHIRFFTDVRDSYSPSGGKNDWMLNVGMLFSFDGAEPSPPIPEKQGQGFYELEVGDANAR